MKSPLLLPVLAATTLPLLFVAVRSVSPRPSLAQTVPLQPVPHPPPTLPPGSGTGRSTPSIGFTTPEKGKVTVEHLRSIRYELPYNDGALWAVQKVPIAMRPQEFKAGLWINEFANSGDIKVVFHSIFADGSPCGTWVVVQPPLPKGMESTDATATFHPPARIGLGYVWVDVLDRTGKRISGYKKMPFAVLPLTIKCSTTQWKPTGQSDEWSRQVHVFAGTQMPYELRYPPGKPIGPPTGPFAKLISGFGFDLKGMDNIPLRLSLAPAAYVSPNEMPVSRLSIAQGVTQMVTEGSEQMLDGSYGNSDPRVVAVQTTRWKLGDSNQIDAAQVVAQLDVPGATPAGQQDGPK